MDPRMRKEALDYHSKGRQGKIEVTATKPCQTQRHLSLAYTPGVAEPCRDIEKNPLDVYKYTAKGNLVAVITNGTAVLGLGNIGPLAGKPVMEGKGVLFKRFADIDVFDIEVDSNDQDEIIQVCKAISPTFGGINLEDIKAPECFYIEENLQKQVDIPVFHDDQHGTAIISGAALLNALELKNKDIGQLKVVFMGAGAAGIACAKLYLSLGVRQENIVMVDSRGVIYDGRTEGMNKYKALFSTSSSVRTLEEAMEGADAFCGVSIADVVTEKMIASMAADPIVFAMANPDPEITYPLAKSVRSDLIMATGRSDYPNQVNNVLGFPFIFRGALDVRATAVNEAMKIAAVNSLAKLAKEDVPDVVLEAYDKKPIKFGVDYIIPKPFDPRVLLWVAPAVAKAAVDSGVARVPIRDFKAYREKLETMQGRERGMMRRLINRAKSLPKRIVFPEGENKKILRAAHNIIDEAIATPILLGREDKIKALAKEHDLDIRGAIIIDHRKAANSKEYCDILYKQRNRKGLTYPAAKRAMLNSTVYGSLMVKQGDADGMVSGIDKSYPDTIRPALQIIGMGDGRSKVFGVYIVISKDGVRFFADTTVNINPTKEELAEIAVNTAKLAAVLGITPRVAMLSFSNFGSARHPQSDKVRQAVTLAKTLQPDLEIDGEMQLNVATDKELREEMYDFSKLSDNANVFIFPDLTSGNIAYKLMGQLGQSELIGPVLLGMKKPVNVLQRGSSVDAIVNLTTITVLRAQLGSLIN